MNKRMYRKPNMPGLSRLLRRGVALALAFSMTLPMAAQAASSVPVSATLATQVKSAEAAGTFPTIEIQTNFVRTEYGTLTGTMELALRVGPAPNGTPVTFQALATTLQFNTALFTPTDWTWTADPSLDAADQQHPIALGGQPQYYQVQLPAMKDDTQAATGAIAQCGIVDPASTDMSTNVADGSQALLFFKAECYNTTLTLDKMTTLAVIRFQVNPTLMNHLSIDRDPAKPTEFLLYSDLLPKIDTDGDGTPDSPATVAGTAQLNTAANTLAQNPVTGETAITLPATDFTAVGFALDGDTFYSESDAGRALYYTTGANQYYFVPGDVLGNTAAPLAADELNVTMKGHTYSLTVPQTLNKMVLAQDPAIADGTDGKYSYTSNLIPAANITFPVVSQMSFADRGDGRGNMATILFYDWDDALIGALVVPRNDDARALVNEYVRDKMVHPALRYSQGGEPDTSANKNLITSLSRANSYRGKYPTTPMSEAAGAADASVDLTGTKYPLTNKLDYVFLKRPMEKDETAVDADGNPTNTWKQQGTATAADWDDEYPYIHGWALIPEEDKDWTNTTYTHPKNLWTTIGMGELETYTGALSGGYQDMAGAPAQLTIKGQEFTFADFDFHNNPQKKNTVYAVKALYEPGENLLDSVYQYRMISSPYYNKANYNSANSGGAYSVDMTYERSTTSLGNVVRGVARIRDVVVQQNSTTDLKWEDPTLNNPTKNEADNTKAKTTYVPVSVDNGEEIAFSLTLSARFNFIDYYLVDRYNSSFVGGTKRTAGNASFNRVHGADDYVNYALWNYNYFTDDSERGDIYYDVLDYADREGSLGFVLNGTLHNIMEQATYAIDPSYTSFNRYVGTAVLLDANIRTKSGAVASADNQTELRNAVKEAAKLAALKKNDPDFWNADKGYAELTYHQLQLYIIDPSRGLLSREDADKEKIIWCNLHEQCVNERTGKPVDWETFIAAARGQDPYKLEAFTNLDDAESLTHLRKTANGGPFEDRDDFIANVRTAVATLPASGIPTWDEVQAALLGITLPSQVQERNFWWYDGSTSAPRLTSLGNTVATVKDVITPVTLPDGNTMARYDKLNTLRAAFEENKTSGTVTTSWNNATKNLCITKGDSQGEKFDSFADFRTAFVDAVTEAEKANVTLEAGASADELKEYWQKLQYRILHPTLSFSTVKLPEMDGYWWYDGNSKIGDLPSLLAAAKRALPVDLGGQNDPAIWNMLTLTDLYNLTDLHFRSNFHGDRYTATDFNTFRGRVQAFVQRTDVTIAGPNSGTDERNNSWNQLQYYLLHPTCDFTQDATVKDYLVERGYYWWRNGKTGESYTLTASNTDEGIQTLMDAVYRINANGNKDAYSGLDADAMLGFRLASSYTTETTWAALPKYGTTGDTIENLKEKLNDLYDAVVAAGDDCRTVNWRQIQHYLLTDPGVYLDADDSNLPSDSRGDKDGYWWREGDEKPDDGPQKTDLDYFLEEFDKFLNGTITDDALTGITSDGGSALDQYLISGRLGIYGVSESDPKPMPNVDPFDLYYLRLNITDLATYMKDQGYTTAVGVLDWYVLQYYAISNDIVYTYGDPIINHASAVNYYTNTLKGNWIPAGYDESVSRAMLAAAMRRPETMVETDEETGIMTTTTPDTITELPGGLSQLQRTVTVLSPAGEILAVTTLIEIYDADYNLISSQTVTMPVTEPEEPVCTCGTETDEHAEDCPLYVAPEEPVCTCDGVDGVHTEGCPLYVKPEEPVCTCDTETDEHAEDCPLYVAPEEPVCTCGTETGEHAENCPLYVAPEEPVCTCGTETDEHNQDCPLYVAPEEILTPEEPPKTEIVCTCGSETEEHNQDCPLYVAPAEPEEPVCTCDSVDGVHTEGCPLYVKPEEPVCTCDSADGIHTEDCPLYVKPEEPVCTCDSVDGVHTEGCPLYVAPEEPVCTCDSADGVHAEDCPLYVAPEDPQPDPEPTPEEDLPLVSSRAALARRRAVTTNITRLNGPVISIEKLSSPDPGGTPVPRTGLLAWALQMTTLVNILERGLTV